MSKGKLTLDVQRFIVQGLACFDTPSVVVGAIKCEFGLQITRQAVEGYDPTRWASRTPPEKWHALFEGTRKAFLDGTCETAISRRSVRLRAFSEAAKRHVTKRKLVSARLVSEGVSAGMPETVATVERGPRPRYPRWAAARNVLVGEPDQT